ncbi:MAG: hypothetical protein J2P21_18500 [Chloracidobacterium sp.]|nr:hypothetical protein [Chloracidobacterium sp.]
MGIDVDAFGAIPASLDAALRDGATAVLFTPRAHNPTGASWSVDRTAVLADVIASHPGVVIIEDDHFPASQQHDLVRCLRTEELKIESYIFDPSRNPLIPI